jgi:beta-galactosidase/beta-glucuronidase
MNRNQRQAVIDEYIETTGEQVVVPADFIEWLRPQHNHIAHRYFFAKDDMAAAQEYRTALFRQFASGLRITVRTTFTDPVSTKITVSVNEFPALLSYQHTRRAGGGYLAFDPSDPASMAELRRQGSTAMASWLKRYSAAFQEVDMSTLNEIAVSDRVAMSA